MKFKCSLVSFNQDWGNRFSLFFYCNNILFIMNLFIVAFSNVSLQLSLFGSVSMRMFVTVVHIWARLERPCSVLFSRVFAIMYLKTAFLAMIIRVWLAQGQARVFSFFFFFILNAKMTTSFTIHWRVR